MINNLTLSDAADKLIKGFEGLRLEAYRDVAGVWTIGYGSTRYHDGKLVKPGDKLTNETQADALLRNTLGQYEQAVNRRALVKLNQNQFDALTSFLYNEGPAAGIILFDELNHNNFEAAADQFLVWNKITDPKSGKKVVCDTLVERRRLERELFLKSA